LIFDSINLLMEVFANSSEWKDRASFGEMTIGLMKVL
jgi:hypothetical protein